MIAFRSMRSSTPLLVLALVGSAHAADAELTTLGSTAPIALSPDGLGYVGQRNAATVARYSLASAEVALGTPSGATGQHAGVYGANNAVYGMASVSGSPYTKFFRHAPGGGYSYLPGTSALGDQFYGASSDGRILAGAYEGGPGGANTGFRIVDGVRQELGNFQPLSVAENGTLIGSKGNDPAVIAPDGTLRALARPAGTGTSYFPASLGSANASTIVGGNSVWSDAYGAFTLPSGTGTGGASMGSVRGTAISPDGSTIAGLYSFIYLNQTRYGGFIWTKAGGTKDLAGYMGTLLGSSAFGPNQDIVGVSDLGFTADGRLVAIGTSSSYVGNYPGSFGWRFVGAPQAVPEPASLAALGVGLLAIARRRARR